MEITTSDKFCIITPLSKTLDERNTARLFQEVLLYNDSLTVGIDLNFVEDCTIEFIENLKVVKNINLFNIPSEIFTIINFMGLDRCINLFVSELDFKSNHHRLLKRNFRVV